MNKGQLIKMAGDKIKNQEFGTNGFRGKILSIEDLGNNLVKVIIEAKLNGKLILIGGDNIFFFQNPPLLVPDGTTRTITDDTGTYEANNFEENHEKAIEVIILQEMKLQHKGKNFKFLD